MARLNIEMDVFAHPGFMRLVVAVGDSEIAIGKLVTFWMLAQKYWKQNRQLIPKEVFDRYEWQLLVSFGFAEIRDSGVYAKGAEEKFEWLLERQEAGRVGGNKSAELRSSKIKQTQANASKSNPPTPTLTPTLKKEREKKTTKPHLIKTWPAEHLYAKVFTNLNRIDAYREIFDFPEDEKTVLRHLERYSLSASDMEQISYELAEWSNHPKNKIVSPRGKLNTFCKSAADRRKKNTGPTYKQLTLEDY